jgi:hypothetical protein
VIPIKKKIYFCFLSVFFVAASLFYVNSAYASSVSGALSFKYQQGTKSFLAHPLNSITLETACDAVARPMAYLQRLSRGSWKTVGHAQIPCWMWEEHTVTWHTEYNNLPIQQADYRILFTTSDHSRNTNVSYKIIY